MKPKSEGQPVPRLQAAMSKASIKIATSPRIGELIFFFIVLALF